MKRLQRWLARVFGVEREWAAWERRHEQRPPWLACYDCGLPYSDDGWCDCVVPHDVWARISPTGHEGGILCLHCMARRIVRHDVRDVPLMVTSGPFRHVAPHAPPG